MQQVCKDCAVDLFVLRFLQGWHICWDIFTMHRQTKCFCHDNLHPSASQTVDLHCCTTLVNFSPVFKLKCQLKIAWGTHATFKCQVPLSRCRSLESLSPSKERSGHNFLNSIIYGIAYEDQWNLCDYAISSPWFVGDLQLVILLSHRDY